MENFAQLEYVMLLLIGSILLAVGLALISIKIAPDVGLMDLSLIHISEPTRPY